MYNIASLLFSLGSWNEILSKEGKKKEHQKKNVVHVLYGIKNVLQIN